MDEGPIIFAVPVRDLPGRLVRTVRTGRSPQGQRVGIAFTRPELLVAAMGADQPWEELCESALRGMLRPLGIDVIQVDPLLVAPPNRPGRPGAACRSGADEADRVRDHEAVGFLGSDQHAPVAARCERVGAQRHPLAAGLPLVHRPG